MSGSTPASAADRLAELLRSADRVLALTGAGISVPSGIPDFRSPGTGLWANVNPMEVAHIDVFRRDPERFWQFYGRRFAALRDKLPNAAHLALAELARRGVLEAVVTQNIDGLHEAAGSNDVLELHGNIWRARCLECEKREDLRGCDNARPPVCQECGGAIRPDVVLFGEMLPPGVFEEAAERASQCDVCLVVGTSAIVYPAAALPEIARAAGAFVVEINPELTPLSAMCDEVIQGRAGEVLLLLEV